MIRSSLLARPGLAHGFTTRRGGVSVGPLASLNLALCSHERRDALLENWHRAARSVASWASPHGVALATQVHGAAVAVVTEPTGPLERVGACDGMVTTHPGIILSVQTADCVPVLLSAPHGVAAAHAGWRGIAAGVVGATVRTLCAQVGCTPAAVEAAMGPHIGVRAFETGDGVIDALVGAGLPADAIAWQGPSKRHANLGEAVRRQLVAAGVTAIERLPHCTATEPQWFSHRRDGPLTGRMASMIGFLG